MVSEKQQHGIGAKERKFIHRNGAEIILDGDTGKVVTDPRWRGTFNYYYPTTKFLAQNPILDPKIYQHVNLDMVPWVEYGSGPNDTSTYDDRKRMSLFILKNINEGEMIHRINH